MSNRLNPNDIPAHAILLDLAEHAMNDSGSEFYSDSEDGGMQLDPPEPTLGHYSMAHDPLRLQPAYTHPADPAFSHPAAAKPLPPRPRMSEEEYAALAVLNDEELLTIYALKSGQVRLRSNFASTSPSPLFFPSHLRPLLTSQTIPQTRRRFQAKLLSGGDPHVEEEMFAARFAVPAAKAHLVPGLNRVGAGTPETALDLNNAQAFLVPGAWKEVVDHDESGWWAPGQRKRGDGKRRGESRGSGENSGMASRSVSRS
ncbi:hypothetical protein N7468_008330 [Penicillium chermesinum]|uniref:Uncharacterized protein n=1 Tax=Penicillium chermesinum TaxID=63820 RepID=A0A9W9TIC7_9EURO|nr:uncharacterized protein N7468_008330 [Penicillium chermesinum]KAJ5223788.1 hypothetical protein N7468_008330 [Penicillium chermesinum]